MRCRLAVVAAVAALAPAVIADPVRVEVRTPPGEDISAGMIDTLRIHLDGAATVSIGAPLTRATLSGRIDEASGALGAGGLATWLEPGSDDAGAYVLVIVGRREGRAAVEVGHLERADDSALSRLLALRVGAFLDETIAAGARSPVAVAEPAPAIGRPPPRALPPGSWRVIAEVGGGVESDGIEVHGDGAIAIGVRRARPVSHLEAVAIGRFGWPRHVAGAGSELSLGVINVGVGTRWLAPVGRGWLGVAAELGARRVRADATDVDGATAAVVRWLPRGRVGVDARLPLAPGVTLRVWLGIERGLEIERFTAHGEAVAAVGALAGTGTVSAVFPLGRP